MADVPRARKGQGLADLHSDCFSDLAICLSEVNRAAPACLCPLFYFAKSRTDHPSKRTTVRSRPGAAHDGRAKARLSWAVC